VAAASEPGDITAGTPATAAPATTATAAATKTASLWTSDDGMTWRPMTTSAAALTRSRLTPFDHGVVLAGVDARGTLSVLVASVDLGSPLPVVAATPTPPFAVKIVAGAAPIAKGLGADASLGPVVRTTSTYFVFVNAAAGPSVYTSADGQAWSAQADAKAFAAAGSPVPTSSPAPAESPAGPAAVADAVSDDQGGIVAVGSYGSGDTQTAAAWHLSGSTWTAASIGGAGDSPNGLTSVAAYKGVYVAATTSETGPRLLTSTDGVHWTPVANYAADQTAFTVSAWSGGFVGSGIDDTGRLWVWTSSDGMAWVENTSWKIPAYAAAVHGARTGLVITSTGVTNNTSWWWSANGESWQDSKLTTSAGCWGILDSGFVVVSAPPGTLPAGATPAAPPAATPSAGPAVNWSLWASRDTRTWLRPGTEAFGFAGSGTCRLASSGNRMLIVGWTKAGVLGAYFGDLVGL
jgi:hypothetical protein